MRNDAMGLFWHDEPKVKVKKEKERLTPPERVWELDTYLPHLEESKRFNIRTLSEFEIKAFPPSTKFYYDIECYPNYFLVAFMEEVTKAIVYFEIEDNKSTDLNLLNFIMNRFLTIGFNSLSYDNTVVTLALNGATNDTLYQATNRIIKYNERPHEILRSYKAKKGKYNHIDLIEVSPLFASLKIYGGRLHTQRMQDLPFVPGTVLNADQISIVRWYCVNDLSNTRALALSLEQQITLRTNMGAMYGLDLRSKSDAQIAEAVIIKELTAVTGQRPKVPVVMEGTSYKYKKPSFISFKTPLMNWVLGLVLKADFVVGDKGACGTPPELKELQVKLGHSTYTIGIGGLHSTESEVAHFTDEEYFLEDRDVVSYYPMIILNLGIYPSHLGSSFLHTFRGLVSKRIEAKRKKNKVIADSLKITINGSFGKTGSKHSVMYSPDLVVQTTLTGQLSLLMLIESLELNGIPVVSANTDGVVIKCPRSKESTMRELLNEWESVTKFETEGVQYKALYSRDVNNYIAVKMDGSTKTKGAYSNPWGEENPGAERLNKNPVNTICIEAVEALITKGIPLHETVRSSNDITKFITVRTVNGGAVKLGSEKLPVYETEEELILRYGYKEYYNNTWILDGQEGISAVEKDFAFAEALKGLTKYESINYLGKAIRWYYAKGVEGNLVIAKTGGKVPKSAGAKPLLDLPDSFPNDVDYDYYVDEAEKILAKIGYYDNQPSLD